MLARSIFRESISGASRRRLNRGSAYASRDRSSKILLYPRPSGVEAAALLIPRALIMAAFHSAAACGWTMLFGKVLGGQYRFGQSRRGSYPLRKQTDWQMPHGGTWAIA